MTKNRILHMIDEYLEEDNINVEWEEGLIWIRNFIHKYDVLIEQQEQKDNKIK